MRGMPKMSKLERSFMMQYDSFTVVVSTGLRYRIDRKRTGSAAGEALCTLVNGGSSDRVRQVVKTPCWEPATCCWASGSPKSTHKED